MSDLERQLRDYFVAIEPSTDAPDAAQLNDTAQLSDTAQLNDTAKLNGTADPRTDVLTLTSTSEPTMNRRIPLLAAAAAVILAVVIGIAALGGDDGTTVGPADTTTSTTVAPPTTTDAPSTTAAATTAPTSTSAPATTAAQVDRDAALLTNAERVIDVLFDWDAEALAALGLTDRVVGQVEWFGRLEAAANVEVSDRQPCEVGDSGNATCVVEFSDDLDRALESADLASVEFLFGGASDGALTTARLQISNPPAFDAAILWSREQPDLDTTPCAGLGTSALVDDAACVDALVSAFEAWRAAGSPGL